jgi:hypothetical protein
MDGQETERDALRMVVLEAVAYEFDMLIVADQLSRWSLPQPARDPGPDPVPWMNWAHNAHIESFLIHARNLLEFFYLKKQSIRARDFIDGAWANIRPPFADTFQLSTLRADNQLATADDLWQAVSTRLSHVVLSRSDKLGWQTELLTTGFIYVGRVFAANVKPGFAGYLEGHSHHVWLGGVVSGHGSDAT